MSRLDEIMQTIGMPAFRRNLGDAAVYTPAFAPPAEPQPVTTWAILNRSSAPVGEFGERMENRLTAQLPKTDVPDPVSYTHLDVYKRQALDWPEAGCRRSGLWG